jgi:hypothetical protein
VTPFRRVDERQQTKLETVDTNLFDFSSMDHEIVIFTAPIHLSPRSSISPVIKPMRLTADHHHLPVKYGDYAFTVYDDLLKRRFNWIPMHIMSCLSSRARGDVQSNINSLCSALMYRKLVTQFLREAYHMFLEQYLNAFLTFVSDIVLISVLDYLPTFDAHHLMTAAGCIIGTLFEVYLISA